jgi:hypothetical protein
MKFLLWACIWRNKGVFFIRVTFFVTVGVVCLRDTKYYLKTLNFQVENSLLNLILMLDDGSGLGPVSVCLSSGIREVLVMF